MKKYDRPELRIERFDGEMVVMASSPQYVAGMEDIPETNRFMINYKEMTENLKIVY